MASWLVVGLVSLLLAAGLERFVGKVLSPGIALSPGWRFGCTTREFGERRPDGGPGGCIDDLDRARVAYTSAAASKGSAVNEILMWRGESAS